MISFVIFIYAIRNRGFNWEQIFYSHQFSFKTFDTYLSLNIGDLLGIDCICVYQNISSFAQFAIHFQLKCS